MEFDANSLVRIRVKDLIQSHLFGLDFHAHMCSFSSHHRFTGMLPRPAFSNKIYPCYKIQKFIWINPSTRSTSTCDAIGDKIATEIKRIFFYFDDKVW